MHINCPHCQNPIETLLEMQTPKKQNLTATPCLGKAFDKIGCQILNIPAGRIPAKRYYDALWK